MANQQHLALLKEGIETWNHWRKEHIAAQPDLSGADLSGADLSGANLSRADLIGTTLSGANLSGANLSGANLSALELSDIDLSETDLNVNHLSGANLSKSDFYLNPLWQANLRGANLSGVNLRGADLSELDLSDIDLSGADLSGTDLSRTDLSGTNLREANLSRANLLEANLSGADLSGLDLSKIDLSGADLSRADLHDTTLRGANLSGADLSGLDLSEKDLSGADLSGANLTRAILVKTNLENANLTDCAIHGISVWNVQLKDAIQSNLIITEKNEPTITVDNLDVAQFIYLLLNNENIRRVIDTIAYKVVLLLGRFTPERKEVLEAVRNELRKRNYLPVLFDFEKPASRDLTETVITLAHLARFIIVDLTDPSSAPYEVANIIPQTVVPVQPLLWKEPLIIEGKEVERREFAMFQDLRRRYPWVLQTIRYQDTFELLTLLNERIIELAEQKAKELASNQSEN